MSVCRMLAIITPKHEFYCSWQIASNIVASIEQLPDGMISTEDKVRLFHSTFFMIITDGWDMKDIAECLWPGPCPSGYEYHTCIEGTICNDTSRYSDV